MPNINVTRQPALPAADPRLEALWTDSVAWLTANTGRIIVAAIIASVVVAMLLGTKWLGKYLARHNAEHNHWRRIIGEALGRIRIWFVAAVAAQIVATYSHAPADIAKTVYFLFVIATTLQAAVFARAIIIGIISHRAMEAEGHAGLASAMSIIRLLVTVALFAIAAILILSNLGVNVTGLIAGLGVGGIAIGLAAQGIFADLFAALAILFDRPFRKGDSVSYDKTSGTVEEIGLKSTRIRSITGELIVIANKQLLEKEIHNLARLAKRRTVTMLGLTYQTDVDLLARMPALLTEIIGGCEKCTMVRCGLMTFGDSSLDVRLEYDVHAEEYQEVFELRHSVHVAILKRFGELGIDFAYPTQVAYSAAPDGKLVLPGESSDTQIV